MARSRPVWCAFVDNSFFLKFQTRWDRLPRVARGLSGRESVGAGFDRWKQAVKTRESGGEEGIRTPE